MKGGTLEVMKTKLLFSLSILLAAYVPISGQPGADPPDIGLSQVTLYWYSPGPAIDPEKTDRSRSAIDFLTGNRGSYGAQFNLRYGGLAIKEPDKHGKPGRLLADWLFVNDCRSMMVDLGVKQWQDFKETPPFPQPKTLEPPQSLDKRGCVVDASAGRTDFSPHRQFVMADPGHMYLARIRHDRKIFYVMFRVESLASRDNCVLSWKLVKPPNVYDNEK
jgi:hypothetical protein